MSKQRSIDIEQIVKDWAWREYDRTATRKQRRLREKEKKNSSRYLNVTLDWSEVKFVDTTDWPQLAEDKADDNDNQSTMHYTYKYTANTIFTYMYWKYLIDTVYYWNIKEKV